MRESRDERRKTRGKGGGEGHCHPPKGPPPRPRPNKTHLVASRRAGRGATLRCVEKVALAPRGEPRSRGAARCGGPLRKKGRGDEARIGESDQRGLRAPSQRERNPRGQYRYRLRCVRVSSEFRQRVLSVWTGEREGAAPFFGRDDEAEVAPPRHIGAANSPASRRVTPLGLPLSLIAAASRLCRHRRHQSQARAARPSSPAPPP